MKCSNCDGNGWYVDFQLRKICPMCKGCGQLEDEDEDEMFIGNDMIDGIPEYVDDVDTLPLLFIPDFVNDASIDALLDDDDVCK